MRQSPATSPTNADSLVFRATFNESVSNVSTGDFTPSGGTTATVAAVSTVSTSVYDVTVLGGNLASFNGTVGLNLAGGQNITDLAGNPLPNTEPATDQDYLLDNAGPTLAEVTAVPTPTTDSTPNYTFSSSEAGSILYGGSCSSATTAASAGNTTVTFNALADGAYTNCTITVTDALGNASAPLAVSPFTVDTTGPTLAEVTAVPTPTNDNTPDYTFSSSEAGSILYGGSCSSATAAASAGNTTVTFNALADGTYSNCTITVTDAAGNASAPLAVTAFTVDTAGPTLAEVTAVPTPTNDNTPDYTFSSSEAGSILYGGSCSSATTAAAAGPNMVTFNALADGTYANCTITVTDAAGNASAPLAVTDFTVDTAGPTLAEVTVVPTPTNDNTPDYTFSSSEAGSILYGGSCSSATAAASAGNTTVTFNALADGTYTNCTITVTDAAGNASAPLAVTDFTVDTTPPVLTVPADISVLINFPDTSAIVTYAAPTSSDANPGVTITQTLGLGSGASFPIGVTTETYRATDAAGNFVEESFTVTVTQIPPGSVTISVNSDVGDGTFSFSSPTPQFNFALTTTNGSATSTPVTIMPGTYVVTVALPSGFGLTAASCTDGSPVDVGTKTATIGLASTENVTCTFATADSRTKTVQTIQHFMNRRADLLLSNDPAGARQIDRLTGWQSPGGGGAGTGFAQSSDGATGPAGQRMGAGLEFLANGRLQTRRDMQSVIAGTGDDSGFGAIPGSGFDDGVEGQAGSVFGLSGQSEGGLQLSFSTSLFEMQRQAAQKEAKRIEQALGGTAGPLGFDGQSLGMAQTRPSVLDVWVEAIYSDFSDDSGAADTDGHFGLVYLGADYVVTPSLLVGALVQFDSMEERSRSAGSDIEGWGWMAGPYFTARLVDNVFLQARAAWGRSDNEVSPFLTYTDEFNSERWLVTGTLIGQWDFGPWRFSPSASVGYIEDTSESYRDSLGVVIPSVTSSLGQAKVGPEVSYNFTSADGFRIEPRAAIQGIWNFDRGENSALVDDTLVGLEEFRGKVEIGLRATSPDGLSLDLSGSYDGLGADEFEAVSGKAILRIPLN